MGQTPKRIPEPDEQAYTARHGLHLRVDDLRRAGVEPSATEVPAATAESLTNEPLPRSTATAAPLPVAPLVAGPTPVQTQADCTAPVASKSIEPAEDTAAQHASGPPSETYALKSDLNRHRCGHPWRSPESDP